jgi:hypothetical protein
LDVDSRGVINMSRRLVVAGRGTVVRVCAQTMRPAVVHFGAVGVDEWDSIARYWWRSSSGVGAVTGSTDGQTADSFGVGV